VGGITSREEYFTQLLKTILSLSLSLFESSFEKAGNSMVPMGVVKKVSRTAKLLATAKLPMRKFEA
jgi:hypothetical protein